MKLSKKVLFVVLAIVGVFLTVQINNAMAFEEGAMYQLVPDDFGVYWTPDLGPCELGSYPSVIPNWCFNPTFLPTAYLFQKPDGSLTGHDDGTFDSSSSKIAEVHFAAEWNGHAVSPHRTYQEAAFMKYEDPELGTMVPHCEWRYSTDHDPNGVVASWQFGCTETRPPGYGGTSLQCENEPFTADYNDGAGMVEVPFEVCANSGIMYVPANPSPPDCGGVPCPEPEGLILTENDDFYFDNMFDVRTYDATMPNFGMINSLGGLTVGIDFINMSVAAQISRVEIISVGGNIEQKIVLTTPDIFDFLGTPMHIYTMVLGSKFQTAPQYDVFAYDLNDTPVQFDIGDGMLVDRWSIYPDLNQTLPPVAQLRKAVLTKNNGIRVKFTAPFDSRNGEIRIRILSENGDAFVAQFRSSNIAGLDKDDAGHYFFTKNDGTVILDKVKVFIPMEYAGLTARIEYRIYESETALRGLTLFKLPAPEPVVEEVPESVVTVECPDSSGLAFVQNGVCACPDGYNYVDGIGCQ